MIKENDKRESMSISLTKTEKDKFMKFAKDRGLSLSAFFRLAALKYIKGDKK